MNIALVIICATLLVLLVMGVLGFVMFAREIWKARVFLSYSRKVYYKDVVECVKDCGGDPSTVSRKLTDEYHREALLPQFAAELIRQQTELYALREEWRAARNQRSK